MPESHHLYGISISVARFEDLIMNVMNVEHAIEEFPEATHGFEVVELISFPFLVIGVLNVIRLALWICCLKDDVKDGVD